MVQLFMMNQNLILLKMKNLKNYKKKIFQSQTVFSFDCGSSNDFV